MSEKDFWRVIEAVKHAAGADFNARPALLQRQLMALTPQEIQGFQQRYEALLLEADRWDLWGAADLMNGGCSDDGFKYFRDWLISEGQKTYKAAVAQPDSLAAFAPREFFELEQFGYAALKAYAAQGAGELERDFRVEYSVTQGVELTRADLPKVLPALHAKYSGK